VIKVLHVIPSLSQVHGGPSRALPIIEKTLTEAGVWVETATTNDNGAGMMMDKPTGEPQLENGVTRWYFPKQTDFYKVSRPFSRWLRHEVTRFDVVHVHALFSYTSVSACRIARNAGVPYIIRPLGVLNTYGMNQSKAFLKKTSLRFIEGQLIKDAAAIHFLTKKERTESVMLPYKMRSTVIPLGIDISVCETSSMILEKLPMFRNRFVILSLGRINLVKGLELLLEAFAEFTKSNTGQEAVLVLAGTGGEAYLESLKNLSRELGIGDSVTWLGHVDGDLKSSLLDVADLFVIPSESESFGIAMVEALGAGIATIASPGVAIAKEVEEAGACKVVERTSGLWAEAIANILKDPVGRMEMGRRASSFVRNHYSIEAMGRKLLGLYKSVISSERTY